MADAEADERRWQAALTVLADPRTETARSALRPAQVKVWILIACVVVVALLAGAGVAAYLMVSPTQHAEPSGGQTALGIALSLVGLTVIAVDLVRKVRRGAYTEAWRAPAVVLSRGQRRSLVRQVFGKEPVDPRVMPLTRDVAARLVRGAQLPLFVGILLQQAGQALTVGSPGYTAFFMVFLALYLVLGAWSVRNARRAQRFLREHADR